LCALPTTREPTHRHPRDRPLVAAKLDSPRLPLPLGRPPTFHDFHISFGSCATDAPPNRCPPAECAHEEVRAPTASPAPGRQPNHISKNNLGRSQRTRADDPPRRCYNRAVCFRCRYICFFAISTRRGTHTDVVIGRFREGRYKHRSSIYRRKSVLRRRHSVLCCGNRTRCLDVIIF
jgi:hypothetical protein